MITNKKKTAPLKNEKMEQFPQMNFYVSEDGCIYFDATHYLESKSLDGISNPEDFRREFSPWIIALQKIYGISPDDMFVLDSQTGHSLIDESLAIMFIAYTDEFYRVNLIEQMSEMEITGITLSDSRLINALGNRFSKEILTKLLQEYDQE